MKIVVITPFPPQKESVSHYGLLLVRELRRRKHEVTVIANQGEVSKVRGVTALFHWSPWQQLRLFRLLRAEEPQVIHVQYSPYIYGLSTMSLWFFLALCRWLLEANIVVTFHEVRGSAGLVGKVRKLYYKLIMRICHTATTHSYEASDVLTSQHHIRRFNVQALQYPVEQPKTPKATSSLEELYHLGDSRVILYLGYIRANKGVEYLIKAFDLLRRSDPAMKNTLLVIAGAVQERRGLFKLIQQKDKAYEVRLQQLVARKHLKKAVFFAGYVPDEQVSLWLEKTNVVVLPHLRGEHGGTLSKALAFQTPIIASDVSSFREVLDGTPSLTPVANVGALSNKLNDFLAEATTAELISQYDALRRPRTMGRFMSKLEKIYQGW